MTDSIEISIIIPTYRPKDYIWECLDSLHNQTLPKYRYEIIIILNGCNQPWHGKIHEWYKEHSEINLKLIQTDTPGVSNARNIGLSVANGRFITFIDDDDYVSAVYLEKLLDKSGDKTVVLSDSRAFVEGRDGWLDSYTPHTTYNICCTDNDQSILHARAIFNGPCMKLIPQGIIRGMKFDISLHNGEDGLMMYQLSKNVSSIAYADNDAIYYRRYRQDSATTIRRDKAYWIKNAIILNFKYLGTWAASPFSYNLGFTLNRLMANIKGLFWHIFNSPINN